MRISLLAIGTAIALALGGCSTPTPRDVCDEFDKDVRAVGVNEDGVAVYRCVSRDRASGS